MGGAHAQLLRAVDDQPDPTRAEMPYAFRHEGRLQAFETAEHVIYRQCEIAGRQLTPRRHRLPEETVVPGLGRVVEQLFVARLQSAANHRLKSLRRIARLQEQTIDRAYVARVVLIVVVAHGALGNHRLEGVIVIWKIGKGEHLHDSFGPSWRKPVRYSLARPGVFVRNSEWLLVAKVAFKATENAALLSSVWSAAHRSRLKAPILSQRY